MLPITTQHLFLQFEYISLAWSFMGYKLKKLNFLKTNVVLVYIAWQQLCVLYIPASH